MAETLQHFTRHFSHRQGHNFNVLLVYLEKALTFFRTLVQMFPPPVVPLEPGAAWLESAPAPESEDADGNACGDLDEEMGPEAEPDSGGSHESF